MSSFTFTDALQVAQIGVGPWGRDLLRNLVALSSTDVVAVCDESDDALDQAQRLAPHARATQDVGSVLADDTIEAVVIATETPTRVALVERALLASKHVFVGKTLASTTAEAERLVSLAQHHDRRLMVGHLLRYHPAVRYVERLVQAGDLGAIRYLHSVRVNLGEVQTGESAFDRLAPHDLSVARALLGEAVAVTAQGGTFLQPGVPDIVFATVEYESGALAHLHCSWLAPHKVRQTTVVGDRRMVVIDDQELSEKVRVYDTGVKAENDVAGALTARSGDIAIPLIPAHDPLRLEMEEFVASVREHRAPRTDGVDGLEVVRILDAVRQSLSAQARVEVGRTHG